MSAKAFRRKDLKHDEFITVTGQATHWLMERRRRIGWALLAVALVVSVVFSVRFAHQVQEQRAAALLAAAMEVYRAPIVPPAPPVESPAAGGPEGASPNGDDAGVQGTAPDEAVPDEAAGTEGAVQPVADEGGASGGTADTPAQDPASPGEEQAAPDDAATEPAPAPAPAVTGPQFATAAEKYRAAAERFQPIVERYGGRPSGRVAAYYLGICHAELGDSEAAVAALTQASEASGALISSMALYRLGQLELGAGNAQAAVGYFERLAAREDGLFPREEALMAQARAHEEAGDQRAALATYQRVLQDFAGSSSEIEARSHVEELSAELGVDPDIQGD